MPERGEVPQNQRLHGTLRRRLRVVAATLGSSAEVPCRMSAYLSSPPSGGATMKVGSGSTRQFDRAHANGRNWRVLLVAISSGEGPLTQHITATQAQHQNDALDISQARFIVGVPAGSGKRLGEEGTIRIVAPANARDHIQHLKFRLPYRDIPDAGASACCQL